jgi:transcriptional regulator
MYLPAHFAWTDPEAILAFCRAHAFATIVAEGADGPEAQHLPLLVDQVNGGLVLHGHAALGDPLWRAARALAVFAGPHAYVSAAWYGEADSVPTWNYLAVHARGRLSVIDDPAAARDLFARLAVAVSDPEADAWQARLSPATAAKLGAMIRWFRIDVEQVEAKAKLSQNRPPALRQRVHDRLAASPDPAARAVAAAMARLRDGQPPWPADPT